MTLYFVRHGQSEANVLNVFSNRGYKHPLTQAGMEQSKNLAAELKGIEFKRVFSSPLLRAIQTASILTKRNAIPCFEVVEALREYDVGMLEGRSDEESWKLFFQMQENWNFPENWDHHYHGGESYNEIVRRFTRFILGITGAECAEDDAYLLVGHGGLYITAMPSLVDNLSYSFTKKNLIGNSELIVVERRGAGFSCVRWGKIPCGEDMLD
jgi:broad specificity phosphatase PhoE